MAKRKLGKQEQLALLHSNTEKLEVMLHRFFLNTNGVIIGIDTGRTSPGIAICDTKHAYNPAVIKTHMLKTTGSGFEKVIQVERWVRRILGRQTLPIVLIVMEGYARESRWGREEQGEMQGILMRLFWKLNLPLLRIAPSQLKSYIGVKQKNEIMKEVLRKWKVDTHSDDQADAVVLMHIGTSVYEIVKRFALATASEREAIENKPHDYIQRTAKEAELTVRLLISRGEEIHAFGKEKETNSPKGTTEVHTIRKVKDSANRKSPESK